MEEAFVKLITDLVGSIGIPGALLMVLAWSWIKAQPSVLEFLTSTTQSLRDIAESMGNLATKADLDVVRQEIRDLRNAA